MASASEPVVSSSVASEVFTVEVVMFSVAVLSYMLRIFLKFRRHNSFGVDDVLITLCLLFYGVVEALIWHYKSTEVPVPSTSDESYGSEYLSRSGVYMVFYWSINATSQLSILWFYRFVCSGFSWGKTILTFISILTISGWIAFTVCDALNLAFTEANFEPTRSTSLLEGYNAFQTASMTLEPVCSCFILSVQLFRLNHIRDKINDKPYLILVPFSMLIVIVTGAARLSSFKRHDIVSERIWLQVHLASAILSSSMPIYTGLETMCCMAKSNHHPASIELWLQDVQSAPETSTSTATTPRISKESCCSSHPEVASMPSASRPATRRSSQSSAWSPSSRRLSAASTRHGFTREIVIEPSEVSSQRVASHSALPSRQSSQVERATKRLILEG